MSKAKFKVEEVVTMAGAPPAFLVYRREKIKWWWSRKWVRIGPAYKSKTEAQAAVENMADYPQVTRTWVFDREGNDATDYGW